jgi:uroporphyrinogen-III synthase
MSRRTVPHVCSFESRRHAEMRQLIERQGGKATVAPSMREIPLEDNPKAFHFAEELLAGRIDVMVFMTGVGARALLEVLETRHRRDSLFSAWDKCQVVVRGPKPLAVLREWKVRADIRLPEPNTWRELLQALTESSPIAGRTVAVQEYGEPSHELYEELKRRNATVLPVPVYRWDLPEDMAPLNAAIDATIACEFDVLIFTSANQINNVLEAAKRQGKQAEWLAAAQKCGIASIGPTASEKLRSVGLPVHVEASPPKMGPLVRIALEEANRRLQ